MEDTHRETHTTSVNEFRIEIITVGFKPAFLWGKTDTSEESQSSLNKSIHWLSLGNSL